MWDSIIHIFYLCTIIISPSACFHHPPRANNSSLPEKLKSWFFCTGRCTLCGAVTLTNTIRDSAHERFLWCTTYTHTVAATKKLRYQTFFYLHSATFFFVEFISQNNDNMNSVLNSLLRNVFFLNVNVNIFPIVQTKTINGGRRKYTLTCT